MMTIGLNTPPKSIMIKSVWRTDTKGKMKSAVTLIFKGTPPQERGVPSEMLTAANGVM